jgi:hypothetical protein
MESTRYLLSYTTSWLLRYATFLDPQTLVLYMEISKNSQNQWVEELILSRCLNGYIPNRIIPRWRRVGSTNTDRQSNSKRYSAWVDYYRDQYLVIYLRLILFSKSTRLMTTDLKATNYVLFNSYDYPKSEIFRRIVQGLFGSGAFCRINWGIPWWRYYYFV